MAEMTSYAIELRAMTQSRGTFTFHFVRYEDCPPAAQAKAIEEAKAPPGRIKTKNPVSGKSSRRSISKAPAACLSKKCLFRRRNGKFPKENCCFLSLFLNQVFI